LVRTALNIPPATPFAKLFFSTVIHGYVQSGATVAFNSFPLKARLADVANLHYVDGPPMYRNAPHPASRPWWILDHHLEHNVDASDRWNETVCFPVPTAAATTATMLTKKGQVRWWSDELSKNQYDGVIGLSQGAAMAALLLSMVCSSQFPTPFIHIWESKTETICFSCVAQQSHERARLPSRKDSAHQIRDTLLRFSSRNFRILFAHSLMRRSNIQASSPNASHTGEYMHCPTTCRLCTVRHLIHRYLFLPNAGQIV